MITCDLTCPAVLQWFDMAWLSTYLIGFPYETSLVAAFPVATSTFLLLSWFEHDRNCQLLQRSLPSRSRHGRASRGKSKSAGSTGGGNDDSSNKSSRSSGGGGDG